MTRCNCDNCQENRMRKIKRREHIARLAQREQLEGMTPAEHYCSCGLPDDECGELLYYGYDVPLHSTLCVWRGQERQVLRNTGDTVLIQEDNCTFLVSGYYLEHALGTGELQL
jgi:hypothetical protein